MAQGDLAPSTCDVGFVERFRHVVAAHRDRLALSAYGERLSYAELDRWSEALAAQLLDAAGTGPEPVIIVCGHDVRAAPACVAIAKTGRPFVFVDTTTPAARIRQVIDCAQPAAAVLDPRYRDLLREVDALGTPVGHVVDITTAPGETMAPVARLDPSDADRVLTVVFTSGSTGTPKGVVYGDVDWTTELLGLGLLPAASSERYGLVQPLSFLGGMSMLLNGLLVGASLHLYDPRRDGVAGMVDWLADSRVGTLGATPHGLRTLANEAIARRVVFADLRRISTGAEHLLASDVRLLWRCTPDSCVIVNSSGSSEGWGVSSLVIDRDRPLPDAGPVPTGPSIRGREVFLLDDSGRLVTAPGELGAIMVAASRMARGYWRNPALTAERFSVRSDGMRVYRTGDLGRWNSRGELEYAGRADHMVKVRGYLVEPAEIEAGLAATGEVGECVVVGRPGRDEGAVMLVAYVVPNPGTWVSAAALRRRLADRLPGYMVPQTIVELRELPHNPNGKVDRLALPPVARRTDGAADVPNWNGLSLAIASICADALGVDDLRPDDDLFELGADSLAVEEILSALDAELGIALTSAALLEHPTVAQLAELRRGSTSALTDGVAVRLAGPAGCDRPPLFIIGGAAALALQFRDLARLLGTSRTVYGLQAYGLEGRGVPDLTITRLARRYVRAVRRIQPHGPYDLAGHSLGSLVAYEMAQRLTRRGEGVRTLGLLDPMGGENVDASLVKRIVPRFADTQLAEQLADAGPSGRLRDRVAAEYPMLSRSFWRGRHADPFGTYWLLGASLGRRYRFPDGPRLSGVPTTVYVAEQTGRAPELSAVFDPAPAVETVPGDHLSMLRRPFVGELAARIAERLG